MNLDDLKPGESVTRALQMVRHQVITHKGQLLLLQRTSADIDTDLSATPFDSYANVVAFCADLLKEAEKLWPQEHEAAKAIVARVYGGLPEGAATFLRQSILSRQQEIVTRIEKLERAYTKGPLFEACRRLIRLDTEALAVFEKETQHQPRE